ncbi:MAG: 3-dehydroquinate synthase [Bacteroidota bacterium]
MDSIFSKDSVVHFGAKAYQVLNEHLENSNYSRVFVIVDSNTHENCLSIFLSEVQIDSNNLEIIEFEAGEEHKTIETCYQIWLALSDLGADRKSLIINLGGGVVTDLGGFVACTFKRGISYVNVPTSLLAMVDASVGGKTGIDLGALKNQVGIISEGIMVLVDDQYLNTLPKEQMRSGLAEMLKHGLISDRNYWNTLRHLKELHSEDLLGLIHRSVQIKNSVVSQDPLEHGIRKSLNFGHTLGHAIESYHLENTNKNDLLHGEAIAIGMILEGFLSFKLNNLSESDLDEIKSHFNSTYQRISFEPEDIIAIKKLLVHDKKNSHGKIKFALLEELGKPKLDCTLEEGLIDEAFSFYQN